MTTKLTVNFDLALTKTLTSKLRSAYDKRQVFDLGFVQDQETLDKFYTEHNDDFGGSFQTLNPGYRSIILLLSTMVDHSGLCDLAENSEDIPPMEVDLLLSRAESFLKIMYSD
jgi:hypothetical protein